MAISSVCSEGQRREANSANSSSNSSSSTPPLPGDPAIDLDISRGRRRGLPTLGMPPLTPSPRLTIDVDVIVTGTLTALPLVGFRTGKLDSVSTRLTSCISRSGLQVVSSIRRFFFLFSSVIQLSTFMEITGMACAVCFNFRLFNWRFAYFRNGQLEKIGIVI